jgi:hypothetical protein
MANPNMPLRTEASSTLGTLSKKSPRIPGAEAPGWPYVVPVGDFLEKSHSIPGAQLPLISHSWAR